MNAIKKAGFIRHRWQPRTLLSPGIYARAGTGSEDSLDIRKMLLICVSFETRFNAKEGENRPYTEDAEKWESQLVHQGVGNQVLGDHGSAGIPDHLIAWSPNYQSPFSILFSLRSLRTLR